MIFQKKLLTVGSTYAKLYLLSTYDHGVFISHQEYSNPEKFPSELTVPIDEDQFLEFTIANACHRQEYQRLRPLVYQNSDIILACFAIDNISSLYYLKETFAIEAQCYCPETPIILVGIKSDLRDRIEIHGELVSVEEAAKVAQKLGAIGYIECSPKTFHNIKEVFQIAAAVALTEKVKKKKKKKKWSWCIW